MRIEDWQKKGRVENLLGREIFFVDQPASEEPLGTVLLIHGFPSASWDWWKI